MTASAGSSRTFSIALSNSFVIHAEYITSQFSRRTAASTAGQWHAMPNRHCDEAQKITATFNSLCIFLAVRSGALQQIGKGANTPNHNQETENTLLSLLT
jgi:hypothetical protein